MLMQAQNGGARLRMGRSVKLQPIRNLALEVGGWSTPILAALPPPVQTHYPLYNSLDGP